MNFTDTCCEDNNINAMHSSSIRTNIFVNSRSKISKASSARSSPFAASPNKSRKSLEVPEIPNNPDSFV